MPKIKPSIPKGTRDFSPQTVAKRNYILQVIRGTFERYGFMPIETPAIEKLSTLTGKYGDEGDQLLFKILNSGDFLAKVKDDQWSARNSPEVAGAISEKGLRYDLTVPFARYVVMHRNDIAFPFRRYQIQPVWRADKPQKGRYREFYQCDADIIGSDSLLNEVELVGIMRDVFYQLSLHPSIHLNNRKLLQGITEFLGFEKSYNAFLTILDKTDKIGTEAVCTQLKDLAQDDAQKDKIDQFFKMIGGFGSDSALINGKPGMLIRKLSQLKSMLKDSPQGQEGIREIETIYDHLNLIDPEFRMYMYFDPTLARGLTYYTGSIFEVKLDLPGINIGSVCGGGRYDDLTGIFGLEGMSGVGISFGLDRIFDVLDEMNLFLDTSVSSSKALFVNFDEDSEKYALLGLQQVRQAGINAEIYPSAQKLNKQMKYADTKGIPFVVMAGSEEIKANKFTLKHMKTGEQQQLSLGELLKELRK